MSLIKRMLVVFLAALMLPLAGCQRKAGKSGIDLPDVGRPSELLTVYLAEYVTTFGRGGYYSPLISEDFPVVEYFLQRLNENVQKSGFNIIFKPLHPAMGEDEEYLDGLKRDYSALISGEAVIVLPQFTKEYADPLRMRGKGQLESIILDMLAGDNVRPVTEKEWLSSAPEWYAALSGVIKDPRIVPAGIALTMLDRPVVVMEDTTAEGYGKDIHTFADYEDFLNWAAEAYPEKVQGLISYGIGEKAGHTHELLKLIAGEYGYFPVDNLLEQKIGYVAPIDSDASGMNYVPIERAPWFLSAVKRLLSLRDRGLIEFTDLSTEARMDWKGYASIVLDTTYWQGADSISYISALRKIYLDGLDYLFQSARILYPNTLPEMRLKPEPIPASYSFIGKDTSEGGVAQWLSFLEWLHGDDENLRLILWGEEGVEYSMQGDDILTYQTLADPKRRWPEQDDYYDYRNNFRHADFFTDQRDMITSGTGIPSQSFIEQLSLLSPPDAPQAARLQKNAKRVEETLATLLNDTALGYKSALTVRAGAVNGFLNKLVSLPADQVDQAVEEFTQSQKENCTRIDEMLQTLWDAAKG